MPTRNGYGTGYAKVGKAMSDNISKNSKRTTSSGAGYTGKYRPGFAKNIVDNNVWSKLTRNEQQRLERMYEGGTSARNIQNAARNLVSGRGQTTRNNSSVPTVNGGTLPNITVTGRGRQSAPIEGGTLPGVTVTGRRRNNAVGTSVPSSVKNTPAKSNKPSTHTIAAGETLGSIAKKYGVDWRQLAKDNGIDNPNLIIAGRKLNINGATKQNKPKKRRYLSEQRPIPNISRTDVINQLAPIVAPSDDVAPAYRGATNPYTNPRQLWI